jgi:hypothetical protein
MPRSLNYEQVMTPSTPAAAPMPTVTEHEFGVPEIDVLVMVNA